MRLSSVEDPDSKVRVIVAVSMLKEGWDVKNIYVICSFRPSISDTLTEQTLGRGLRLPWGAYTGQEFLDTVEVLSHERYADILKKASVLLDGLVARRLVAAAAPATTPATGNGQPPQAQAAPGAHPGVPAVPPATVSASCGGAGAPVNVTGQGPGVGPEVLGGGLSAPDDTADVTVFADMVDEQPAPAVVGVEDRKAMGRQAAANKPRSMRRVHNFTIPRVRREVAEKKPLSLSDIVESDFRALGEQMGSYDAAKLSRMELTVIADPDSPTGLKLVPTEVDSVVVNASIVELPLEDVQRALKQGLLSVPFVSASKPADGRAATRLAKAFIDGAGSVEKVSPYVSQALVLMRKLLAVKYRQAPDQFETHLDAPAELPEERVVQRKAESNRYGQFSRALSYTGWSERAAYPEAWFHSEPERAFANLLDSKDSATVSKWARLHNDDLVVEWEGGKYNPDFVFTTTDGIHYLVEVKGQDRLTDPAVVAKAKAAADWARFVSDDGSCGEWRYLFVPQSEVHGPLNSLIARLTVE